MVLVFFLQIYEKDINIAEMVDGAIKSEYVFEKEVHATHPERRNRTWNIQKNMPVTRMHLEYRNHPQLEYSEHQKTIRTSNMFKENADKPGIFAPIQEIVRN